MRIGLYCKNVSSVLHRPDNDSIVEEDRSLRIINKFLYSLTKPVEVCTTMAAYLILTDGALFESSHQFVYKSLSLMHSSYPDQQSVLSANSSDHFVDVSIPLASINSSSVDLSPMHLYWDRPSSMAEICYIDCVELYHPVKTKGIDGNHWVKNSSSERKVLIITGRQLPNLARPLTEEELMFYYKSLLILFKPHHSMNGLVFYQGMAKFLSYS
ncbi:hypothetical protein BJ741DRAFT_673248 [Chytriomyces cf. hyalinus JEL632]|nr:hypothetical protein BJ741DRAFT_673248 [Chytriomyces cf. hyalinus JEL632]